jgi:hypothetical protein
LARKRPLHETPLVATAKPLAAITANNTQIVYSLAVIGDLHSDFLSGLEKIPAIDPRWIDSRVTTGTRMLVECSRFTGRIAVFPDGQTVYISALPIYLTGVKDWPGSRT